MHGPRPPLPGGLMLRSQPLATLPSQLSQPLLQLATAQLWVAQVPVPLVIRHWVPHAPQLVSVVSGSQPLVVLPSQLSKPLLHVPIWQVPVLQVAVALLRLQPTLQPPQCVVVL